MTEAEEPTQELDDEYLTAWTNRFNTEGRPGQHKPPIVDKPAVPTRLLVELIEFVISRHAITTAWQHPELQRREYEIKRPDRRDDD